MPRRPGPRKIPTCGHPDRKHHGHGRCYKCWYRANRQHLLETGKAHYHKDRRKAKDCTWRNYILREYGLTVDAYSSKLQEQDGVCAICHEAPVDERLCVDHNHQTGVNRGLLCRQCNLKFDVVEKWPHLDAAFQYLHHWEAKHKE